MTLDDYEAHPGRQGDKMWSQSYGSAGRRTLVFSTPPPEANYIRGLSCDVQLVYKRPWLEKPDKSADRHIVRITVNE